MIPIKDHSPPGKLPIITHALIAINVLVFGFMLIQTPQSFEAFIESYALEPNEIVRGVDLHALITAMFLHGGVLHILGNMLFLHIFGDNLENAMGKFRYLVYYLVSGLGGSMLQIAVDPLSKVPNLGASGAIAGLMGGYLVLFPRNRVDVLFPVGGFLSRGTVPAWSMLFYWILTQLLLGFGSVGVEGGGVAYFAHIGGFVSGVVLVKVLAKRSAERERIEFQV